MAEWLSHLFRKQARVLTGPLGVRVPLLPPCESVLGFSFIAFPWVILLIVGFVNSWDYEKAVLAIPMGNPISMGAAALLGIYAIALAWVISKAIRIAKANKSKANS